MYLKPKMVLIFLVFECLLELVFTQFSSFAAELYIKKPFRATIYGWLSYENSYSKKTVIMSNTSYVSPKNAILSSKWKQNSRTFARIGFKIFNHLTKTKANITLDSWPQNFNLMLAFVRQDLGNGFYVTVGKDWSLVEEHTFSSYCFLPFPVGFQGSKRFAQVKLSKEIFYSNMVFKPSISLEYRPNKNSVVIGKNINQKGSATIAESGINSSRTDIPAIALSLSLTFRQNPINAGRVYTFAELEPIYLYFDNKEHKENPYTLGCGLDFGFPFGLTVASEYIHTLGMSGVSGIEGNNLKTFSYLYKNGDFIKRESNAYNIEGKFRLSKGLAFAGGFDFVYFKNKGSSNSFFLKNEVKHVKTTFLMLEMNTTKLTKLFIEFRKIETKYAVSLGKFYDSTGDQIWAGYRYYF